MNVSAARHGLRDPLAHTRMSFGDHIEELRGRLIRALLGFLLAMGVGLLLGQPLLECIQAPVQKELNSFYARRNEALKKRAQDEERKAREAAAASGQEYKEPLTTVEGTVDVHDGNGPQPASIGLPLHSMFFDFQTVLLGRAPSLISLTVTEPFMTYFKVSMYSGVILASPWIFYQLWMFVAAGLYRHEKKYVYLYLPLSLGLFLGGVALCEFLALPLGVHYLLSFNAWLGVEPELRLSDWLNFAVMMPLIFGVAFQTPLVMLFLERLGIVRLEVYTKNRRIAVFILAVVAALLAAAPDALNMLMLALPMWGLYELGILLCRFAPRPKEDIEEPHQLEMVEV
jgi:sec-independent protein translocase protein TatC